MQLGIILINLVLFGVNIGLRLANLHYVDAAMWAIATGVYTLFVYRDLKGTK